MRIFKRGKAARYKRVGRKPHLRTTYQGANLEILNFKVLSGFTWQVIAHACGTRGTCLRTEVLKGVLPRVEVWTAFQEWRMHYSAMTSCDKLGIVRVIPISMEGRCEECGNFFIRTSPARKFCNMHLTGRKK